MQRRIDRATASRSSRLGVGAAVIGLAVAAVVAGCSNTSSDSRTGGVMSGSGTANPGTIAPAATAPRTPTIEFMAPSPGQFTTSTDTMVQARVTDAGGRAIRSVRVNGQDVTLAPDNTFSMPVGLAPGINTITVRAENEMGDRNFAHCSVIRGDVFGPATGAVDEALLVRVNPQAFPPINAALADAVANLDINAALTGLNPLFSTSLLGGILTIRVDLLGASIGSVNANLDLVQDGIALVADVQQIRVDFQVQDTGGGIPLNVTGNLSFDSVMLDAALRLDLQPDGTIKTRLDPATVQLNGLGIGINGVPSALTNILAALLGGIVQQQVSNALTDRIPPFLDQKLAELTAPKTVSLLGKSLSFQIKPTRLDIRPDGLDLTIALDLSAPRDPSVPAAPGYTTTPSTAPVLGANKAFLASIDDDALNRAFFVAWQGGLMNLDLDNATLAALAPPPDPSAPPSPAGGLTSLNFGALAALMPELASIVPPQTPLVIKLRPAMPPVVTVDPAGLLRLQIGEFLIEIHADQGGGSLQKLVGITVHADVPIALDASDGNIAVVLPSRPQFLFTVVDEPLVNLDDLRLQTLLTIALDALLPNALDAAKFPVPAFGGLRVVDLELGPDGPQGDYITVGANLIKQ